MIVVECPRCLDTVESIEESAFVAGFTCNVCELLLEREHLRDVRRKDCTNPFCRHFLEGIR